MGVLKDRGLAFYECLMQPNSSVRSREWFQWDFRKRLVEMGRGPLETVTRV